MKHPKRLFLFALGVVLVVTAAFVFLKALSRPSAPAELATAGIGDDLQRSVGSDATIAPPAQSSMADAVAKASLPHTQATAGQNAAPDASQGQAGGHTPTAAGATDAVSPSSNSSAKKQSADADFAYDLADLLADADLTDPQERARIAFLAKQKEQERLRGVLEKARSLGLATIVEKPDGGVSEIFDFDGDEPVYRTTFNHQAGISSGADILRGGGFGNLSGAGVKVGVWDGGLVRPTHQEFSEGQVVLRNLDSVFNDHATHVAATLAGVGFKPDAQGMAPASAIDSYFWRNDHGEMILAGASLPSGEVGRIPVSNHSYGIIFQTRFGGHYEQLARATDAIAYNLPYYLQFWAAGNSQEFQPDGFFSISHYQLAKNIITVGAVEDAVSASGVRDPSMAAMSDFSSWGPAKDGRIKPDLVANGVGLYSAIDFSDQSYDTKSGTSMASPSAAGTAALLVELYRREFGGQLPLSSLLKALLIHTADDIRTADDRGRPGPDYEFGWGLINGQAAGELIKENGVTPRFFGGTVGEGARRWTHTFTSSGAEPVKATLVWLDPPGEVRASTSQEPNLVHNLDLKIVGPDATEHLPYVMPYVGKWTPASLTEPAVRGKNNVDNVEQVELPAPAAGEYSVVVTVDGPLTATQSFSLVLTGAGAPLNPRPVVNLQAPISGGWFLPGTRVAMAASATDLRADGTAGVIAKVDFLVDGQVVGTDAISPYRFDGWVPPAGTYLVEARATDSEGAEAYSNPAAVTIRDPLPGEVHPAFTPPAANDAVLALAEDDAQRIYIGGLFTVLNGNVPATRLARLLPNGSIDTAGFRSEVGPDGRVRVLQFSAPHQALYVAGDFARIGTVSRAALARLHVGREGIEDGTLDEAFSPVIASSHPLLQPSVRALLLQPDGKIIVGGLFDRVNGLERRNLARINADGTLDESFDPAPNAAVAALALQHDGKILIGGEFTSLRGVACNRLARLEADGSLDASLVLGTGQQTGFNGPVHSIAADGTGEIYVGGAFTAYRGHPYHFNLVKLQADGALEGYFNFAPGLNGAVNDIHLVGPGQVLVSGAFTAFENSLLGLASTAVGRVAQFLADGNPDSSFNPDGLGANAAVNKSLRLASGNFLLAGSFTSFNDLPSARLAMVAGSPLVVPSPVSRGHVQSRLKADSYTGAAFDFAFYPQNGSAPLSYSVQGELPRGLTFDHATGRLSGVPLEGGTFEIRFYANSGSAGSTESVVELQVAESAVSYEQWRDAWFSLGETTAASPHAIHNPAGLSNLEVYALSGGDPRRSGSDLLPQGRFVATGAGNQWEWVVPKFGLANRDGIINLIYEPEATSDIRAGWQKAAFADEGNALRVPSAPSARQQFFRVKVIRP